MGLAARTGNHRVMPAHAKQLPNGRRAVAMVFDQ
jgi:hypothetical protein